MKVKLLDIKEILEAVMNLENLDLVSVVIDAISLIVAVTIPVVCGVWGLITSTRKYELTTQLRLELLSWYTDTSRIMVDVIHYINYGMFYSEPFAQEKIGLLSRLSAQIELGRFYFPNVPDKDGYGMEKPLAYQGNRHAIIEFVYKFYVIACKSNSVSDCEKLWKLEREYTSEIFSVIDPRARNKKHKKYTNLAIDEDLHYFNYLAQKNGKK